MENEAGSLSRVVGLFSARGYNIESLSVAPTDDDSLSRLTLVTRGSDQIVEQIMKQLNKLIEVVKIMDLTDHPHLEREMMLVKVGAENSTNIAAIKQVADIFRGKVIDLNNKTLTIELSGSEDKIEAFIEAMREYGIQEVVRSGCIGLTRGALSLRA